LEEIEKGNWIIVIDCICFSMIVFITHHSLASPESQTLMAYGNVRLLLDLVVRVLLPLVGVLDG
jgi:hypothetical protein